MNTLKSIFLTLLVLLAMTVGYCYTKFDQKYALKKAYCAFKDRNYNTASNFLSVLNSKKYPQSLLYKSYVLRAQKDFKASSALLCRLKYFPNIQPLLAEIEFNQFLNLFLEKDFLALKELLNNATQKDSSYYHLFEALGAYESKNYQKAKDHFDQIDVNVYPSKWLEQDWNHYFSALNLTVMQAECELKIDQPSICIQRLESHLKTETEVCQKLFIILGQANYILAKQTKVPSQAIKGFKKAFSCFQKVMENQTNLTEGEQKIIQSHYLGLISELLDQANYEHLGQFVNEATDFKIKVSDLTQLFLSHIYNALKNKDEQTLKKILWESLTYCQNPQLKEQLLTALYFHIENLIKEKDIETLALIWPHALQKLPFSDEKISDLQDKLMAELSSIFEADSIDLQNSQTVIKLLTTLNYSPKTITSVAKEFKKMWLIDAEKAWILSQFFDHCLTQNYKKLFHQKMLQVLNRLEDQLLIEKPYLKTSLKTALDFFEPSENTRVK